MVYIQCVYCVYCRLSVWCTYSVYMCILQIIGVVYIQCVYCVYIVDYRCGVYTVCILCLENPMDGGAW